QENWAVISRQVLITDLMAEIEKDETIKLSNWFKNLFKWLKKTTDEKKDKGEKIPKMLYRTEMKFSPIYDSGSSMGRELLDDKVDLILNNEAELNRYIERGTSEIHWNNKKVNHFELINHLLQSK